MNKGEATKIEILDVALEAARREGLDALTIGSLARALEMSKSGLFAHFQSKQNLQCAVLEHAADVFTEMVMRPAFALPRGEPRLRALFDNWLAWAQSDEVDGGCIFLAAATELDDKEGPVRDYLVATQDRWLGTLARCIRMAQDEGQFRADLDIDLVAYQFYANMMSYHFYARLMRDPKAEGRARETFEQLLQSCRS
jgi:AcrR family transcriptional regulator